MITRDVAQLKPVVALDNASYDASCGGLGGGTSTANHFPGLIIDRMGLGRSYNSVRLHAGMLADIGTSTLDAKFGSVMAWLYHSSTTCADDFDRFSTDQEIGRAPLYATNATSTLAGGYMATSTSVGTFGTFSATATGSARADYSADYDLTGAQRYLRPYVIAEAYASSSGGTRVRLASSLIFGEPDEAPSRTTSTGAAWKN